MSEEWLVNSDHTKEMFLKHVEKMYNEHKYITFTYKTGKQRTKKQNSALHVYFKLLADKFNDAGLDMKKVLKPEIDIPWTEKTIKEFLWRPVQKAILDKSSTTKPDRKEYTEVYEVLNRHTAEKFGISLPFPSKE